MVAEEAKDGFLGGEKPSAADFNVFGVLRSLESFTTEQLMLEKTRIGPWYNRMAKMHSARGQGSKIRGRGGLASVLSEPMALDLRA